MSATERQAEPAFRADEFLETLLRIKRDQPRRYAREVGAGQQRRVELYEERKARASSSGAAGKAKAA